jgi:hypothetical protein
MPEIFGNSLDKFITNGTGNVRLMFLKSGALDNCRLCPFDKAALV